MQVDNHMVQPIKKICPTCDGEKVIAEQSTCKACGGSGCDVCENTGTIIEEAELCPDCGGTGFFYIG